MLSCYHILTMKAITIRTIETPIHPETKKVFWNLFASSRGAPNRVKIMLLLRKTPANAHQISTNIEVDYKCALHHLKILEESHMVEKLQGCGMTTFFVSPLFEENQQIFDEIVTKV